MFRCQCDDQCWIRAEEKVPDGHTPPVGNPTLRRVVRPVMRHVAALAEGAQVLHPVVGRVAIEMRRGEHDPGHPELGGFHKIGPPGRASLSVPPGRRLFVEPPAVRQATDEGEVWSPAALTPAPGALEANVAAQLTPVRRIERS
jgi:hypothetical protein